MKRWMLLAVFVVSGFCQIPAASAVSCELSSVREVSTSMLSVAPTGVDDTKNIQCAIDKARDESFAGVQLEEGIFRLSDTIFIDDFQGTINGISKDLTLVTAVAFSYDCSVGDYRTSMFQVTDSDVKISRLAIQAEFPCSSSYEKEYFFGISFSPPADRCGKRVNYGQIDRVRMRIFNRIPTIRSWAVVASYTPACGNENADRPIGSLKVNRSEFQGWERAVSTSMVSEAQVDINFNTFVDNALTVTAIQANQLLSVNSNSFTLGPNLPDSAFYSGVYVNSTVDAPQQNSVIIAKNSFTDNTMKGNSEHISLINDDKRASLRAVITTNSFETRRSLPELGFVFATIGGYDVDNVHVSNNKFLGPADTHIAIWSYLHPDVETTGWTIVGNDIDIGGYPYGDVYFDRATRNNIVGPDQNIQVVDQGNNLAL